MSRNIVIGVAAIAIAAAGGYFAQRAISDRMALEEATPPPAGMVNKPVNPDVTPDLSVDEPPKRTIPEVLPDISLPDRQGVTKSLASWKGQPLLINFWATWCGPCREEIPLLKSLRKERAQDRLEVVGIAIDERQAVLKFANEIGIDYPILMGEQEGYEAAERFGVALVLPFSVFADSQGRIVTLKIGELHANEAAFILDRVRDVDANRLPLDDARRQIADKLRDFATERAQQTAGAGAESSPAAARGPK